MADVEGDVGRGFGGGGQEEAEDLNIPRAAINKMIKDTLPNIRVSNDARDLVTNCCTEFIRLIAARANQICEEDLKRTISPEHALDAMDALGFAAYRQEATAALRDCKEAAAKRRRASTRLENLGVSEEELLRQQQELFARAREAERSAIGSDWARTQEALRLREEEEEEGRRRNGEEGDDDDDYD